MEILAVKELSFTYPQTNAPAVSDVSFSVRRGELVTVCGATGSGKSTLLRLLKRELSPLGEQSGTLLFSGTPLPGLSDRDSASRIGFVMQDPEQQIVTDKVWHELAFGLENLALPQQTIALRTAETASWLGISDWYDRDVAELSGGQKQILNLASVMAMQPDLLILDEPTAQLDPIAAAEFINALKKLNTELSLTVIIAEHRLGELIPISDRLMVLEEGRLIFDGEPRSVISQLRSRPELMCAMPAAAQLYTSLGFTGEDCPLTVREGRNFIEQHFRRKIKSLPRKETPAPAPPALELEDVFFRYDKHSPDILRGLTLTVRTGEIFCILGGNGSGKTTALSAVSGIIRPYSGTIRIFGRRLREYKNQSLYRECLALMPQDVRTMFLRPTVREELSEHGAELPDIPFDISQLLDKHPYDLSGGEQQLVGLAKVLAAKPKLLLMDEPTKGLDSHAKLRFISLLRKLRNSGMTIVAVTHDVELAAQCADRCAMFFLGTSVSVGTPDEFFGGNNFYTTAAGRMSRGYYENVPDVASLAELCRLNGEREDAR